VVNLTSPTFTVPNLEGMDVPNVVTSSSTEEMATIDIIKQPKNNY
jgi:hypothetical protein